MNGCHNRDPFVESYGKFALDSETGRVVYQEIKNVMSRDCVYTTSELGQQDKGCEGCKWKKV